jgi:hypothetical protein
MSRGTSNFVSMALTSLTSGGHSVSIVYLQTKATEFVSLYFYEPIIEVLEVMEVTLYGCGICLQSVLVCIMFLSALALGTLQIQLPLVHAANLLIIV